MTDCAIILISTASNVASEKCSAGPELSEEELASTDETEEQRRLWTKHVFVDISSDGKFLVLASQKEIAYLTGTSAAFLFYIAFFLPIV